MLPVSFLSFSRLIDLTRFDRWAGCLSHCPFVKCIPRWTWRVRGGKREKSLTADQNTVAGRMADATSWLHFLLYLSELHISFAQREKDADTNQRKSEWARGMRMGREEREESESFFYSFSTADSPFLNWLCFFFFSSWIFLEECGHHFCANMWSSASPPLSLLSPSFILILISIVCWIISETSPPAIACTIKFKGTKKLIKALDHNSEWVALASPKSASPGSLFHEGKYWAGVLFATPNFSLYILIAHVIKLKSERPMKPVITVKRVKCTIKFKPLLIDFGPLCMSQVKNVHFCKRLSLSQINFGSG